ncbi:MAG: hypothetical protein IJJ26_07810 [Victivallales bacterium]|nr:hypothetical protein [Victivallales bacterium]
MKHTFPRTLCLLALLVFAAVASAQNTPTRWFTCGSWTTDGTFQTPLLLCRGVRWRINYRCLRRDILKIEMYDENNVRLSTPLSLKDSDITQGTTSGSIELPKMKFVWFRIEGGRAWTMNFEQYVSEVDAWELMQASKNPVAMARGGIWSGNAGVEREFTMPVNAEHSRILVHAFQKGHLRIDITGPDGRLAYTGASLEPGTIEAWFHKSGTYQVRVSPMDTAWTLQLDHASK